MCKKVNFYTYLCSILHIMYEYLHNYELRQIQHNLCKIFTHFFLQCDKPFLREKNPQVCNYSGILSQLLRYLCSNNG